jgi:hypothetical protein
MKAPTLLRMLGLAAFLSIATGIWLLTRAWHGGPDDLSVRKLAVGLTIAGFALAIGWLIVLARHDVEQ